MLAIMGLGSAVILLMLVVGAIMWGRDKRERQEIERITLRRASLQVRPPQTPIVRSFRDPAAKGIKHRPHGGGSAA